jgi:hypothetical protein
MSTIMTKKTTKTKAKEKKPRTPTKKDKALETISMQSLLLGKDELLVYKDEDGEYHILCKEEYNPRKDYQVLFLTYEDI